MPNWTSNTLTIEGTNDKLAEFISKVQTEEQVMPHIFDNLYPCPQELIDTVSGHIPENSPEHASWKQKQADNIAKYGYKDWYDWQVFNWGVKWGDSETCLVTKADCSVVYSFDTAWSPPLAGMRFISEMFPDLTFILRYQEMGMGFAGCAGFRNGFVVDYSTETIETPEDIEDESEEPEDFWDKVYEAYEEACTNCEDMVRDELYTLL